VSVLLGNGDGTFQAAVDYGTGNYPFSVTSGDFNGDGKPDLAVANTGSDNVSVLLGNARAPFRQPSAISPVSGPKLVAIGDFNATGSRTCRD